MRRSGSNATSKSLDAIRLAIGSVREAPDMADALQQVCVGAARVTGGDKVVLAIERAGRFEPAAHIGRLTDGGGPLIQRAGLSLPGAIGVSRSGDPMVAPFPAREATGVIIVQGGREEALPGLELFAETASAVLDLQVLRNRTAAAAHRIQPLERLGSILSSLRAGDGVVLVAIDELAQIAARSGSEAVDSLTQAAGIHLLNATRPPDDVVSAFHDSRFLVILRDLKAPVEVVGQRVVETWQATRASANLTLGAALHLDSAPPMQTLERAEAALASATSAGGGQFHVSPSWNGPRG